MLKKGIPLLLLLISTTPGLTISGEIPAEALFGIPNISNPVLSPDGNWIAYLYPGENRKRNIQVIDLRNQKSRTVQVEDDQDVHSLFWLNDQWVGFSVHSTGLKFRDNFSGTFAFDVEAPDKLANFQLNSVSSRLIDTIPARPNEFWLHLLYRPFVRKSTKLYDNLVRFDLLGKSADKGSVSTAFTSYGKPVEKIQPPATHWASDWVTDIHSIPRIALLVEIRSTLAAYTLYDYEEETWKELPLDPLMWTIHGFLDEDTVLVSGYGERAHQYVSGYNIQTCQWEDPIFAVENEDIHPQLIYRDSSGKKELLGCHYDSDHLKTRWIHPRMKEVQKGLDQALSSTRNTIVSLSNDLNRFLVLASAPMAPPVYYFCDIAQQKLQLLASVYPEINQDQLVPVYRFAFPTEDDLRLEAYFTKSHSETTSPSPTIVLIHGGPWARDYWTFDSQVQYLASLGYNVLQVNYRGSEGYGSRISWEEAFAFENMMEDIRTAIDFGIQQKWIDPGQIALMGGSFGAYASIFLGSKYPDRFQCIIATSGIYDWEEHLEDLRDSTILGKRYSPQYRLLSEHIGDLDTHRDYLRRISPIHMAEKIKCPVMVVHGLRDWVITFKQSKRLIQILEDQGIPVDHYFEFEEGHGMYDVENRIRYYKKVAEFLAKHLSAVE